MTIHWIAGIARSKPRTICGKATFTEESNGTTNVPNPTTNTPKPGCCTASPSDRVIRSRSDLIDHAVSDRFLQCRRGFETNRFARFHLDRFTGPRIEALARLRLPDRERSEAWQREFTAFLQFLHDGVHQIAGRAVGRRACQIN